jgi:hypothetical protein
VTVPPHHIEAEIAAWPFWSCSAFERGVVKLGRDRPSKLDAPTQAIADSLVLHLCHRSHGRSLDALETAVHGVWFSRGSRWSRFAEDEPATVALHEVLVALAVERLRHSGDRIVLREDGDGVVGEAAVRWRWLSLALPPDLLIAALREGCGARSGPSHVSVAPLALRRLLEPGLDEVHLHLGAALPFDLLWSHLMQRCAVGIPEADLGGDGGGPVPFGGVRHFGSWLVVAAIARLVLAGFLWRHGDGRMSEAARFLDSACLASVERERWAAVARSLRQGRQVRVPTAALRQLYRRLGGIYTGRRKPRSVAELIGADPLAVWPEAAERIPRSGQLSTTPEMSLLTSALSYLRGCAGSSVHCNFAELFWQYVRVRGQVYRYVVQDPGVSGLSWFGRHYQRMKGLRKGLTEPVQMEAAAALEARDVPLRSLELRTAPEASWTKNRDLCGAMRELGCGTVGGPFVRSRCLVLHFVKERGRAGGPFHADPRQRAQGSRYGGYVRARRQEALALIGCLRRDPRLLRWMRGLDVCNLELSIPTWVIAPVLQWAREQADTIAARSGQPQLGVTLHAGEEYTRLIGGLRQVHEPLGYGLLRRGDRLGHAVALGTDPDAWARDAPIVMQRADERLDDLVWELQRYYAGEVQPAAGRADVIRREAVELAGHIFGDQGHGLSVDTLLAWNARRHCRQTLERLHYPSMLAAVSPTWGGDATRLLHAYLTDLGVFARGQRVVAVRSTAAEIEACARAQHYLVGRLASLDIAVEANPSSNLLIANMTDVERHPIFRLQPLQTSDTATAPALRMVLGDDDPITFCTSLADEYAYLYFALLQRGVGVASAEAWLEQVRQNAARARFAIVEPGSLNG